MNRAELIDQIRDRLGVDKRAAENAVDVVLDTIQRAVAAGEKVAITGFGVFEKVERAARTGRNPRTGAAVKIKKTAVPKFRPGTQFKGVVSGAVKLGKVADAATKAAAKSATSTCPQHGQDRGFRPGQGHQGGARRSQEGLRRRRSDDGEEDRRPRRRPRRRPPPRRHRRKKATAPLAELRNGRSRIAGAAVSSA